MSRFLVSPFNLVVSLSAALSAPVEAATATVDHQPEDEALRLATERVVDEEPNTEGIINGTPTGSAVPYMVGLGVSGFPIQPSCGGSLIAPSVVLTAAHCYVPIPPLDDVYVNLYEYGGSIDPGVSVITLADPTVNGPDIVLHPDYDKTNFHNDVALLFLPAPVTNPNVQYVTLNEDPDVPANFEPMRATGWGRTDSSDPNSFSPVLRETTVNVFPLDLCKKFWDSNSSTKGWVTDNTLCYENPIKQTGTCSGDSGGPLVVPSSDGLDPLQVGIVSWGPTNPCAKFPTALTRVSSYVDWIKETVCARPEHASPNLCGSPDPNPNHPKSGKSNKSSKISTKSGKSKSSKMNVI